MTIAHEKPAVISQDDEHGARLSNASTILFAICAGLSMANVYYAQPLLDHIAHEFQMRYADVGVVITATQIGCALALLFIVPLGDLINRRRLMLIQLALLAFALLIVAFAPSSAVLLLGMITVGLLGTAMTQGLIAFAASLAAPHERGRVIGIVSSGVVIGLLMARAVSGLLADLMGWRSVYFASAALVILILTMLFRILPNPIQPPIALSYAQLLRSMLMLIAFNRTLQIRGVIAMLMFAVFSMFWTTLVLPLAAPPMSLSHTAIGALGLIGVVGALAAAHAGLLADKGLGQWTTGISLGLLVISWLPIGMLQQSLWALALGILILDLAIQALHVTNQSLIFNVQPEAQSRLIGCYMIFYAIGSGLGSITATHTYAVAGWTGVCLLGAGTSLSALIFWAMTLPLMTAKRPSL